MVVNGRSLPFTYALTQDFKACWRRRCEPGRHARLGALTMLDDYAAEILTEGAVAVGAAGGIETAHDRDPGRVARDSPERRGL